MEIALKTNMSREGFLKSLNILVNKPHVINKRLWGMTVLLQQTCTFKIDEVAFSPLLVTKLIDFDNVNSYFKHVLDELNLKNCELNTNGQVEITIVESLPKNYTEPHSFQLIYLDKVDTKVTFYDVTPQHIQQNLCPNFTYSLYLKHGDIILQAFSEVNPTFSWLENTVLPQFMKWGEENSNAEYKPSVTQSLALISKHKYYYKYNDLKLKYGKEMVKIWPECTDPSKFVYEDVAIATYLLLLWKTENNELRKQKFIDLGCGNGLLVYILMQEGHEGVGIDIRKRQIWDIYPKNIKLEERTIEPSDKHLFPDADWIIGNHSDELTPWIPVIAARSSYKCNFFLLPCCPYNFNGTKYQRKNSSKSQYTEYLEHIHDLCKTCGFKTSIDRLKIPSTKRICLIGEGRTYDEHDFDTFCNSILELVKNEVSISSDAKNTSWIQDFKPREKVERVRNCTQIEKSLIDSIVNCITKYLLEECELASAWSIGRTVEINEVVQLISQSQLKSLKAECGGLQTLLKNNHHIFKVEKGKVCLRYPKTVQEVIKVSKPNIKVKQKPCWFYNKHPQGCPLTNEMCSFLHCSR